MSNRREKEILAGSVVVLPGSSIGLSEKAGMRDRDWNRKGEREKQREGIPVAWHTTPKEAWSVVRLQCKTVRNKLSQRATDLLLLHFVFCSLYLHKRFCHNQVNKNSQIRTPFHQLLKFHSSPVLC